MESNAAKECDPTKFDADIGVLSCGEDSYCQESPSSSLGGVCATNKYSKSKLNPRRKHKKKTEMTEIVECDPSAADIGILCGEDAFCRTSSTSALGGVCTSRRRGIQRRHKPFP